MNGNMQKRPGQGGKSYRRGASAEVVALDREEVKPRGTLSIMRDKRVL